MINVILLCSCARVGNTSSLGFEHFVVSTGFSVFVLGSKDLLTRSRCEKGLGWINALLSIGTSVFLFNPTDQLYVYCEYCRGCWGCRNCYRLLEPESLTWRAGRIKPHLYFLCSMCVFIVYSLSACVLREHWSYGQTSYPQVTCLEQGDGITGCRMGVRRETWYMRGDFQEARAVSEFPATCLRRPLSAGSPRAVVHAGVVPGGGQGRSPGPRGPRPGRGRELPGPGRPVRSTFGRCQPTAARQCR